MFKTTEQIFSDIWATKFDNIDAEPNPANWIEDREMTVEDVKVWEEIEYVPGCYGIYVSWDPFSEFYLVTFNQFINESIGMRTFSGREAADNVIVVANKLGCNLD